jgi:hypothetical protein
MKSSSSQLKRISQNDFLFSEAIPTIKGTTHSIKIRTITAMTTSVQTQSGFSISSVKFEDRPRICWRIEHYAISCNGTGL